MSTVTQRLGGLNSSLFGKAPVRVATTANISLNGLQVIDGVTLADADFNLRVLVKNQTAQADNGIWVANSGAWTRDKDWNAANDFVKRTRVSVQEGTFGQGDYVVTSIVDENFVIDETAVTFSQVFTGILGDLVTLSLMDDTADYLMAYDSSASAWTKVLGKNLGFTASGTGAVLRSLQSKLRERVDLTDFMDLSTRVAGTTDDTAAFQAAVNTGKTVEAPDGIYLIAGNVAMPYGAHIVGKSRHATVRPIGITGGGVVSLGEGAIIYITSTSVSPFTYYSGNSFRGLTFYYPNQLRTQVTPTAYPWTFAPNTDDLTEVLVNNSWDECQFVNSYQWIDARRGHLDFEYTNLVGCPIYRGIDTDGCGGTDIFRNIRGSYYYWCVVSDNAAVWVNANAIGLRIGRSDEIQLDNIYFGNLNIHTLFYKGSVNTASGAYGKYNAPSYDGCNYGFYVDCTHPIGIDVYNPRGNTAQIDIEFASGNSDPSVIRTVGQAAWGTRAQLVRLNKATADFTANGGVFFSAGVGSVTVGTAGAKVELNNCRVGSDSSAPLLYETATPSRRILKGNTSPSWTLSGTPAEYLHRGNQNLADSGLTVTGNGYVSGAMGIGVGAAPTQGLQVAGAGTVSTMVQQWDIFSGVTAQMRAGSDASPDFGTVSNHPLFLMANSVRQGAITTAGLTLVTPLGPAYGGTGVANNAAATLTRLGNFDLTLTLAGGSNVNVPVGANSMAVLEAAQTWTGVQQFADGKFALKGATSGTLTQKAAAVAGSGVITWPAGTTDFSATGGGGQVVKQATSGGAFTVGQLQASELLDGNSGTGAIVHVTSATLVTPSLGAATGTSLSLTGLLTSRNATATPAAASAVAGVVFGSALVGIYWGTGDPNGALTAPQGSLYTRTDGGANTRLYINNNAGTGWAAVTSA